MERRETRHHAATAGRAVFNGSPAKLRSFVVTSPPIDATRLAIGGAACKSCSRGVRRGEQSSTPLETFSQHLHCVPLCAVKLGKLGSCCSDNKLCCRASAQQIAELVDISVEDAAAMLAATAFSPDQPAEEALLQLTSLEAQLTFGARILCL